MGNEISDELSWLYRKAAEAGEKALAASGLEPYSSGEWNVSAWCEEVV